PGEKLDEKTQLFVLQCNLAISVITFPAATAYLRLRSRATFTDLGFDVSRIGSDLWCGTVAFVAAAPVVYAIQAIFVMFIQHKHPLLDALENQPSVGSEWFVAVSAVVVAPVFEEFLLRGVLQGWLEKMEQELSARAGIVTNDDAVEMAPETANRARAG